VGLQMKNGLLRPDALVEVEAVFRKAAAGTARELSSWNSRP
jgi:hypothetical protein